MRLKSSAQQRGQAGAHLGRHVAGLRHQRVLQRRVRFAHGLLGAQQVNRFGGHLLRPPGIFDQVGQRRNFYAKPCEDAILMTLYFKFIHSIRNIELIIITKL